ncbi:MAG: alpha/beta fold hydrolase [Chloroflexi bacterium]|nr:alpha/beta fold hydrolase [Chloroflexota bacterium]
MLVNSGNVLVDCVFPDPPNSTACSNIDAPPNSSLITDTEFMTHRNTSTRILTVLLLIVIIWGVGRASHLVVTPRVQASIPDLTELVKLDPVPNDTLFGGGFGTATAIDGDTLVVGAPATKVDGIRTGLVHVFVRSGATWSQQAVLAADDGENDNFGGSVSISGDRVVVGATGKEAAYVFVRSGTSWSQQAKLIAADGAGFGGSVSISGDTLAVGAKWTTVGGNSTQGSVYVFAGNGASWTQQAKIVASDGAANDEFGSAIAISGETIVVGVPNDAVGTNAYQGSAYVFLRSEGVWSQQAHLIAADGEEFDEFGNSVSLDGDTIVVGDPRDDIGSNVNQGSAYVFARSGTDWSQQAHLTATDGEALDGFATSVSVSGDMAVVGFQSDHVGSTLRTGSAYVFGRSGDSWSPQARLTPSGGNEGDRFGSAASISSSTAVVTATRRIDLTQSPTEWGAAWVFSVVPPEPPLPVVFVPGVAGSVLMDRNGLGGSDVLWMPAGANFLFDLNDMTLFDGGQGDDIVAPDVLRAVLEGTSHEDDVYGGFLEGLATRGFREYDLNTGPVGDYSTFDSSRLTSSGCDVDQKDADGKKPNLFLFPYDWRLDNAVNAAKLDDYVDCMRQIYPDSDFNLVTHSMGGLIGRRYVLDHMSDHHIDRWVSIAAPWLGAPKLAFVLETGEFVPEIKHVPPVKAVLKDVLGSFDAVHQLLPSQDYFDLGGPPVIEEFGVDLDGNGVTIDAFSGQELYDLADIRYGRNGFFPGTTAKTFHSLEQDDWRTDTSGIEFFHLLGVQSAANTIEGFTMKMETVCLISNYACSEQLVADPGFTIGDGTVPRLSAERIGNADYNFPGATLRPLFNANDDLVDHNHMMRNPEMVTALLDFLAGGSGFGSTEPFGSSAAALSETQQPAIDSSHITAYRYVKIIGPSTVTVLSGSGGSTALANEVLAQKIPGVDVLAIGDNAYMVLLPAESSETFDLDFNATGPIFIEVLTGDGSTPDEAIRYQDVNLPDNAATRLSFTLAGARDLSYDSDGNGSFDATSTPTAILTGAAAADTEGPVITLTSTSTGALTQVTLAATDSVSGVASLYYSTDGASFIPYAAPFTVDLRASSTVHAFANDGAANRSSIVRILASTITGQISLQGVKDQGAITSIGPTATADNGSTSTTVAVNADGTFAITGLSDGAYSVTVQAPGFVQGVRASSITVAKSTATVSTFELRSGLVDSDGVVSIRDISAIAASFGVTGLTDRLDAQGRIVDLNGSGNVDILDISAAASNFGAVSPQNWN